MTRKFFPQVDGLPSIEVKDMLKLSSLHNRVHSSIPLGFERQLKLVFSLKNSLIILSLLRPSNINHQIFSRLCRTSAFIDYVSVLTHVGHKTSFPSCNMMHHGLLTFCWLSVDFLSILFHFIIFSNNITKLYLDRVLGILAPIQNYKIISESCSWYPSTNPELQNYIWIVYLVSLHQSRITKLYLNRVLGILAPIKNY